MEGAIYFVALIFWLLFGIIFYDDGSGIKQNHLSRNVKNKEIKDPELVRLRKKLEALNNKDFKHR
jgi:hypothetical protein